MQRNVSPAWKGRQEGGAERAAPGCRGCRPFPPAGYFVVLGGGRGDAAADCGEIVLE
ncbi:hypothetical protein GCM10010294_03340 [Streptomyces griseoloalbus]|nr:hypothetical protein GCM10010294_03340 [Streptomyces griseoloalbus]